MHELTQFRYDHVSYRRFPTQVIMTLKFQSQITDQYMAPVEICIEMQGDTDIHRQMHTKFCTKAKQSLHRRDVTKLEESPKVYLYHKK